MGRVRSVPSSRVPLHRLVRTNPEVIRRWLVVIGLAGFTATLVGRSIASADTARSQWGRSTTVLVTTSAIDAGLPLEARIVAQQWPVALAPPTALRELPAHATAIVDLDPGLPLTSSLVNSAGAATEQQIHVAVPLGNASMTFSKGDRVDLWSTTGPTFGSTPGPGDQTTQLVAVGAVVVEDSDGRHLVAAVTTEEAEHVVEALALTTVTPVVVG